MAMKDLKSPKSEKEEGGALSVGYKPPDYDHGLTVRLGHHHVKKLGLHKMGLTAGDEVHLHSKAHVKSIEHTMRDGKPHHSVELELRHAEVKPGHKSSDEMAGGMKDAIDKALGGDAGEGDAEQDEEDGHGE